MISLQVFMLGVLITSTLTGLATEAIKTVLVEHGKKYYANTLAGVVSMFLSLGVGIGYMSIYNIALSTSAVVYLVSLVFASWLCAMIGYDKVVQAVAQFKTTSVENTDAE